VLVCAGGTTLVAVRVAGLSAHFSLVFRTRRTNHKSTIMSNVDDESEFKITQKQYDDAQNTFHLFDKKGNGQVSTKELSKVFQSLALKVDQEKLKSWADDVDDEATGFVNWDQFKVIYETKLKEDEDERELKDAFRVLDKGNKGVIDVKDLRWILESLGDDLTSDEIEDMITETDTDGSGTVDYEEFAQLMNGC